MLLMACFQILQNKRNKEQSLEIRRGTFCMTQSVKLCYLLLILLKFTVKNSFLCRNFGVNHISDFFFSPVSHTLSAVYWCHDFGSILSSVAESGSTCQYIFQIIVHSVFFCFTSGIDPRVFSLGTSSVICRQSSLIWLLQLCATNLLKFLYSFAGEAPERGICDYILTGISFLIFLCTLPVSLCFTLKVRP